MRGRRAEAIWIYGPPGVGKSTTGWALFARLADAGLCTAYVDIDQLGMCSPVSASDPDRHSVKARNVGQVLKNFHAAGAQVSVVSGVFYPEALDVYDSQLRSIDMTFCRLAVGHDELRRRNHERGGRDRSDIDEAVREAVDLERSNLQHPVVDTEDIAVDDVTRRVAALLGPPRTCPSDAPPIAARSSDVHGQSVASDPGRVILVCGPAAVGKSSVAWELFVKLHAAGHVAAFVDLAQIGFLRPESPEDKGHVAVRSANLAALWTTFAAAGASHLIVNGFVSSEDEVESYRAVLPEAKTTVCRLTADKQSLRRRVFERRLGAGPPLAGDTLTGQPDGFLNTVADDAARMDRLLHISGLGDVLVDTTNLSIDEAATVIGRESHLW